MLLYLWVTIKNNNKRIAEDIQSSEEGANHHSLRISTGSQLEDNSPSKDQVRQRKGSTFLSKFNFKSLSYADTVLIIFDQ